MIRISTNISMSCCQ